MEVRYSIEKPSLESIYELYNRLGWNDYLKMTKESLNQAMENSFFSVYVFNEYDDLIGMGRVISDSVINAYVCGIGVISEYRKQGIGAEITKRLINKCLDDNLHIQLLCEEHLVEYYKKLGFELFTVGMKFVGTIV